MKARLKNGWKVLLAVSMTSVFAFEGCTADLIRQTADLLYEQANEMDGENLDFGDWLANEIRDW